MTMGHDPTEPVRREMMAELNAAPPGREELQRRRGQVWDTAELGRDFEVMGFMAPLVVVRRKADGVRGSLTFQHHPRFYFDFQEDA